jgi:hypothetical protein
VYDPGILVPRKVPPVRLEEYTCVGPEAGPEVWEERNRSVPAGNRWL